MGKNISGRILWKVWNVPPPGDMFEIPGEHTREVISRRRRKLRKSFFRSWRDWRRIIDIIDLLIYNVSLRR